MSVKIMHLVFERFPLPGNDMVLALALADHAHDDGTNIYPGNERLATKTRMSERTVIRLLKKFCDMGWLIKTKNSNFGRGIAAVYRISPEWISGKDLPLVEPDSAPLKSDNLSPFIEDEKGDKNGKRVTPEVKKGDTTMSPQPSLTIKTTINTACASSAADNKQIMKPEGLYACRLIKLNVGVTSMHPTLHAWVRDGITLEQLVECVGIARQQKPEPERIAPNYLDKIVRSQLKPKVDNSWLMTDDGVMGKGREVGLLPKVGESMQDYRARVKQAVLGGDGKAA